MMKPRRPTRIDVAQKAGVSPSTVTLVLGDKGDILRIAEATQQRVREAARLLGYYPNKHIQSVLRGKSGILGIYLRWDQWVRPIGYWTTVFWHIQRAAADLDVQLLVHNAKKNAPTEESFARQAGGIVDGVMIINSQNDPIVARLMQANLPAVEVGDSFSPLPFVGLDGKQGIRLAAEHLFERGYRHPALLSFETNYVENSVARENEFKRFCESMYGFTDLDGRMVQVANGYKGFEALQSMTPRPDSVICLGDEMALDLMLAAEQNGLRVPEDLAIVGFDAIETIGTKRVLTSVETPLDAMAHLAVQKLLDVIDGKNPEHETILPVGLRIGDTT